MQSVLRYLMLLQHVPREPQKVDVQSLRKRLAEHGVDVSVRTIQRNLNELSEVFPLIADDRSKPFGWSLSKTAPHLPFPDLPDNANHGSLARVKLKCSNGMLNLVTNNPLHPEQRIERNGLSFFVTFVQPVTKDLIAWILSCGENVEVIEPHSLRDEIEGHVVRMHARYNGKS
ncbi:WYL domain-containing protein [Pseudidiomarina andamanensis]|nr:WYL domain-containing protein [Pseudidiomarina andamanensis]MDS0219227.1 WYL domain-containing protein [Pseudidiomarina andamanensis]